jgi:hypothetical protein
MILKIKIIGVYFGMLPTYFPLWLKSCQDNPNIEWLVFIDSELDLSLVPPNVYIHQMDASKLQQLISEKLQLNVPAFKPYKICDFRPAFGVIFDDYLHEATHWGHCDFDMLFGDLTSFITDDLDRYEKIFSVGHLTIYRNDELVNRRFMEGTDEINWMSVFTTSDHVGFDEHIGVNKIWANYTDKLYVNEEIIADIDPNIEKFELCKPWLNKRNQVFTFESGKIFQVSLIGGKLNRKEFMYIHFQKRKFTHFLEIDGNSFLISSKGFFLFDNDNELRKYMHKHNRLNLSVYLKEIPFRTRRFIRLKLRGEKFVH